MLTIPLARLPFLPIEQRVILRDYFCDKDATARRTDDGWTLTLDWPDGEARHVDPRLAEGLAWWGNAVTRSTMALANRRSGRILTAMYDTWTLQSWSEWLARQQLAVPKKLTILHVDDHFDLAAPRLFIDGNAFRDAITGLPVDFHNPDSVKSALLSGALGMGSFLTPFLHVVEGTQVRHLRQPPRTSETIDYEICLVTAEDTLLEPGAPRPAVRLDPRKEGAYRVTSNIDAWLDAIGNGQILLHIDMDYFNNRYDGDSDWAEKINVLDPTLDAQLLKIDELTGAIRRAGIGPRIADVVLAYSPGFFPAEFWSAADHRLRTTLEQLL